MLWENYSAVLVLAHSSLSQTADIVSFYVFVTNGVHLKKDGELPGTSYEAEFRYASIRFLKIQ